MTPRETQILELVARGLTNGQIAAQLGVTVHVVKSHLTSIYRKLGVANRTEAARFVAQAAAPAFPDPTPRDTGEAPVAVAAPNNAMWSVPPIAESPAMVAAVRTVASGRAREECRLGAELTRAIRAKAAAQIAGEASFVLAALGALLHRYAHLPRIVVYSGARPLRLDATGDPSFFELVSRVDRELAVEVVATAARSRDDTSLGEVQSVAVTGEPQQPCELELEIDARLDELVIAASFDRELLEPPVVQQLLRHLVTLLAGALHDPSCHVSRLSVLTPAERTRLLDEWNDTTAPFPVCRADELIMLQGRERAAEVAVEFEGKRLTYGELEARANALAHHLQGLGVGPGVLVALWVERSLEMLVGVLGIMRAGGTYVPIDPEFPRDRQQFMLDDAEIGIVVTQERLVPHLPLGPVSIVCLDRDAARIAAEKTSPPPCTATADNLAYVIYTSGSTGTPKGVQISAPRARQLPDHDGPSSRG